MPTTDRDQRFSLWHHINAGTVWNRTATSGTAGYELIVTIGKREADHHCVPTLFFGTTGLIRAVAPSRSWPLWTPRPPVRPIVTRGGQNIIGCQFPPIVESVPFRILVLGQVDQDLPLETITLGLDAKNLSGTAEGSQADPRYDGPLLHRGHQLGS
jgi:hypothetical protein